MDVHQTALIAANALRWSKILHKRDRKGPDWCKEKGIGKEREKWKPQTASPNIVRFNSAGTLERHVNAARWEGFDFLGSICNGCPLPCELRAQTGIKRGLKEETRPVV